MKFARVWNVSPASRRGFVSVALRAAFCKGDYDDQNLGWVYKSQVAVEGGTSLAYEQEAFDLRISCQMKSLSPEERLRPASRQAAISGRKWQMKNR